MIDLGEIEVLVGIVLERFHRLGRRQGAGMDPVQDVFELGFHGRILTEIGGTANPLGGGGSNMVR